MIGLKWSKQASANLRELHGFVAFDDLAAADRQVALVLEAANLVLRFPNLGRAGRVYGTREFAIQGTPYILVYKKSRSELFVLALIHGAQRWPKDFD